MDSAGERFVAIQEALADRKNILTVKELCELAGVSRSGYYNWVRSERARETREQRDRADFEWILEAYRFRSYAKGARGIHMRLLHMGVRMNEENPPAHAEVPSHLPHSEAESLPQITEVYPDGQHRGESGEPGI